jgi:hypothetical protein
MMVVLILVVVITQVVPVVALPEAVPQAVAVQVEVAAADLHVLLVDKLFGLHFFSLFYFLIPV